MERSRSSFAAASKRYSLRPSIVDLGMAALGSLGVPRQMESELERLAAISGGSTHLGVLDGTDVIIVARSVAPTERRRFVTMQIYVGSRLPAHCSALGRILLANNPDLAKEAVKPENIVKPTPLTETNPDRIAKILAEAKPMGTRQR
ncbi:DNA-binding IclR family transcriptional regulator [Nitrobacteraceae bacterium AZCC 1564]